jgi:hypothetical protein
MSKYDVFASEVQAECSRIYPDANRASRNCPYVLQAIYDEIGACYDAEVSTAQTVQRVIAIIVRNR